MVWRGESGGELFDTFDLNHTNAGVGFFFAEDRSHAQTYAGHGTEPRSFTLRADRVLDLTDPYRPDPAVRAFLHDYANQFEEWVDRGDGEPRDVFSFLEGGSLYDYEGTGSGTRWNALFREAWDAGFDAVRVLDSTDGAFLSAVWVVKDPLQIVFQANESSEPAVGAPRRRRAP